ncbi:HAD family hydrolase [Catenovulum sediminis]|uniref:HAD family hydrolase n=1 Tax=Catenovulum sediminis TaxID=1740262 RepID=UPI00117E320B|nr:HAD-IA family hydrolase [Catenovulum sediminis]
MCTKTVTKPKAILFDLDGTLLDTAKDLGETLNLILKKLDLPAVSYDDYRPVASHGAMGLLKLGLGDNIKAYDIEVLRKEFLSTYQANINLHTRFFDGMRECLKQLQQDQLRWGVVTNKPEFLTTQLLAHYPEFSLSGANISGDTLPVRKPDPAPLTHACKLMDIDAKDCWYIGDAQRDIEAGNRAGMTTLVANWGYTYDPIPVSEWQADYIIEHPLEIIDKYK